VAATKTTKPKPAKKNQNKTVATAASVDDFIAAVANETRRKDAKVVLALMQKISGEKPKMWGPTIVGFGTKHYKYESGREGDICLIGFSPRGGSLVLYLDKDFDGADDLVARLGKVKTSMACLYINKLADVDMAVLEELIARSWAHAPSVEHKDVRERKGK
jgi:hypothetical protein